MSDWIALLGVKGGPAIRPGSNMPTATLIHLAGKTVLVDAGLGSARGVCEQGVPLPDIDLILITHLHSDHYLELGPLLHTAWLAGLDRRVPVIGPTGLKDYWRYFLASMQFDIALRIEDEGRNDLSSLVEIRSMTSGQIHRDGDLSISAMLNDHPPIDESFALRLDAGGKSVVLSGDTAYMPAMAEFAKGTDILVHEAMLPDGVDVLMRQQTNGDERLRTHILRSHAAARDVGRVAADAGVKQLVLNHFVPDGLPSIDDGDWVAAVRETWAQKLTLGTDGARIEF